MRYAIACSRVWYEGMAARLGEVTGCDFLLIREKDALSVEALAQFQPRYVFFPHWSHIIPEEIHRRFECVVFHMTDLPFGRGGSPLQNLIARGIYETRITALKCETQLDAGAIYCKRPLSLYGGAEEIYLRAAGIIEEMIAEIVELEPEPEPQQGEPVCFKRRKKEEGDIAKLGTLQEVFDYIRMLDAEGYPNAFIEAEGWRLEFQRPVLRQGKIIADVTITKKGMA